PAIIARAWIVRKTGDKIGGPPNALRIARRQLAWRNQRRSLRINLAMRAGQEEGQHRQDRGYSHSADGDHVQARPARLFVPYHLQEKRRRACHRTADMSAIIDMPGHRCGWEKRRQERGNEYASCHELHATAA